MAGFLIGVGIVQLQISIIKYCHFDDHAWAEYRSEEKSSTPGWFEKISPRPTTRLVEMTSFRSILPLPASPDSRGGAFVLIQFKILFLNLGRNVGVADRVGNYLCDAKNALPASSILPLPASPDSRGGA
jgi:hypothetical protein